MSKLSGWELPPMLIGGAAVVAFYQGQEQDYLDPRWISRPSPIWYEESLSRQLRKMGNLKDDWDGYGGAGIEPNAVTKALSMLSYLAEYPQHLTPSASGTVLLEWESPRGKASLELGRETFGFYTVSGIGRSIFLSGNLAELDSEEINNALSTIIGHHTPRSLEEGYLAAG